MLVLSHAEISDLKKLKSTRVLFTCLLMKEQTGESAPDPTLFGLNVSLTNQSLPDVRI